jgi:hypothetical protein
MGIILVQVTLEVAKNHVTMCLKEGLSERWLSGSGEFSGANMLEQIHVPIVS